MINDRVWAPSADLGYLILLSGDLYSDTFTVDAATDVITTATTNNLITGSRVRVTTTGVLPATDGDPLNTSTDYYAIAGTDLQIALTLTDAIAGTAINFVDTGSGSHTLSEQRLTESDSIAVLINKELTHSSYNRSYVGNFSNASAAGVYGEKNPHSFTYSASGSNMVFRHVLFLRDASSTIGDTTGTEPMLTTESAAVTVVPGTPKVITQILRTQNA